MFKHSDPKQAQHSTKPKKFAKISVAARGLYALEHTLFEENFKSQDLAPFRCKLIQAITRDLTRTTEILFSNWQDFAQENKQIDLTRDYFKSLVSGLEVSANHRLSVPLGTIEKPRPKLAEVWRSGRTTRHIGQSIVSLHELSNYLSSAQPNIMNELNYWFLKAKNQAGALNDPILFGVSDPVKRLEIEALRTTMQTILFLSQSRLGPALGVSAGFNSGDGD